MANILHTMHKCPRVFSKGEGEVASPWITPYPGSRARISESGSKHECKSTLNVLGLSSNHRETKSKAQGLPFLSMWKSVQWILAYPNLFYPNARFIRNK